MKIDTHSRIQEWITHNRVMSVAKNRKVAIHPIDNSIYLVDDGCYNIIHNQFMDSEEIISMAPIDDVLPFKFSDNVHGFHIYDAHLKSFNNLPNSIKNLMLSDCTYIPIADLNSRSIMQLCFADIKDLDLLKIRLQNRSIKSLEIGGECGDSFYDFLNYDSLRNIDRMRMYLSKKLKNLTHLLTINVGRIAFYQHTNVVYHHVEILRLERIMSYFLMRANKHEYTMDCALMLAEHDFDCEI